MRGRRPWLALVALACALVAGCGGPADVPTRAAAGDGTAEPSTASAPAAAPAPMATAGIPTSQRRTFVPTAVRLPSGTVVQVDPAGVDDKGVLAVPADISRAGWWTGGARAGDPFGGVVVAGHVDSLAAGIGKMGELVDVRKGDAIELRGSGERRLYRVTSTNQVPKARLSGELGVFDQLAPERLVLITCAGRFDPVARHYADNLVVLATPVRPS